MGRNTDHACKKQNILHDPKKKKKKEAKDNRRKGKNQPDTVIKKGNYRPEGCR